MKSYRGRRHAENENAAQSPMKFLKQKQNTISNREAAMDAIYTDDRSAPAKKDLVLRSLRGLGVNDRRNGKGSVQ